MTLFSSYFIPLFFGGWGARGRCGGAELPISVKPPQPETSAAALSCWTQNLSLKIKSQFLCLFVCFPGLKGNLALCIPILTYFISVIGTRSPSFPSLQSSKQVHSRMRIRPHPPSFTLPVPWGGEIITSTLRKHQYFTFNELGRPNYLSRLLISEIVKYGCGFDGNRVISEMGISDTQSIK